MFVFLFFIFFCILCLCTVLYIVFPFEYSCPFLIFVQVYQSLPPGGKPIAVNQYHMYKLFEMKVPRQNLEACSFLKSYDNVTLRLPATIAI